MPRRTLERVRNPSFSLAHAFSDFTVFFSGLLGLAPSIIALGLFALEATWGIQLLSEYLPRTHQWIVHEISETLSPNPNQLYVWDAMRFPITAILTLSFAVLLSHLSALRSARLLKGIERTYSSFSNPALLVLFALHLVLLALWLALRESLQSGRIVPEPGHQFYGFVSFALSSFSFAILLAAGLSPTTTARRHLPKLLLAYGLALVCTWISSELCRDLWRSLCGLVLRGATAIVHFFGLTTVTTNLPEHLIGTPEFTVRVWASCSGFEGMILFTLFFFVFCALYREALRFPNVFLLYPLGIGLMLGSNVVRIATLIAVGATYSVEVAMKGFHSCAGWLTFNLIGLGIVYTSLQFRFFSRPSPLVLSTSTRETAPYLGPFLAILFVQFASGLFSPSVDLPYPIRVVAGAGVLLLLRDRYGWRSYSFSWRAFGIGALVAIFWMSLLPAENAADGSPTWWQLPPSLRSVWVVFRCLGAFVIVPVAEELAFRGYLLRRVISEDFASVPFGTFHLTAFLASSLVFGLLHSHMLAGFIAGLAFAGATLVRRRFSDAITAHATANVLVALSSYLQGRWAIWS